MNNESSNIVPINEDLNVVEYEVEKIKSLIYTIRGKQVMLDSDVAMLYHCETRMINQVVKRNIERFPEEFCFQLTKNEFDSLRSQIVTLKNSGRGQHRKYLPYVFTEHGIAMISVLLKSEIAIKVSINIMKAFIEMRNFMLNNANLFNRLTNVEYKLLEHDQKINQVFNEMQSKEKNEFAEKIFFDGQIFDAYSLIIDIIKRAKSKIVIIDNYIDESILKMLAKKVVNVEVVILTSPNCNLTKLDINKFNKQYPTLKIARSTRFHDRFIIIDGKELYHCGASLKDLGKKCFAISKMEDMSFVEEIRVKEMLEGANKLNN